MGTRVSAAAAAGRLQTHQETSGSGNSLVSSHAINRAFPWFFASVDVILSWGTYQRSRASLNLIVFVLTLDLSLEEGLVVVVQIRVPFSEEVVPTFREWAGLRAILHSPAIG